MGPGFPFPGGFDFSQLMRMLQSQGPVNFDVARQVSGVIATSDPETSYAMLTPEFQQASGGFERYSGFWSTISSARVYAVAFDPQALTTTYTIDYVTTSGRTTTEQGRLQLVRQGDGYLIAGEA